MASLLSLPHEIKRMIFSHLSDVHRFATLCSSLLPVIRECTYNTTTVTSRNLYALIEASRKLEYRNLKGARAIDIQIYSCECIEQDPTIAVYLREFLQHVRPVHLLNTGAIYPGQSLREMDMTRLRSFTGCVEAAGIAAQLASTTLERLTITSGYHNQRFNLPEPAPTMTALRQLAFPEIILMSVSSLPVDLPRFLASCVMLSTLSMYTEDANIVERLVQLCGKTLIELEISIGAYDSSWTSSTSLSVCTPQLQVLRLEAIGTFFLQPFPQSLRRLELAWVYLTSCADILADFRVSTYLQALSFLRISLENAQYEDDIDEEEERAADLAIVEISKECWRRGIVFDFNDGYC